MSMTELPDPQGHFNIQPHSPITSFTSTTSLTGSHLLDLLPVQRLKKSGDGQDIFRMRTQWDDAHQKPYLRMDMIEAQFRGEIVDYIEVDDIRVPFLLDQNNVLYHPLRTPYNEGILVLYMIEKSTQAPAQQEDTLSEVLRFLERMSMSLLQAINENNSHNTDIFRAAIMENMAFIRNHPADDAKIATTRLEELLSYPVPRYFFVHLRKKNIVRKTLRMYLLCESGIYHHGEDEDHDDSDDDDDEKSKHNRSHDTVRRPMGPRLTHISDRKQELPNEDFEKDDSAMMHLSNHPGYKIIDSSTFCKNYGHYVLKVMQVLHFSVVLAGIVVPGLTALGHSALYTSVQAFLNYGNQSFSEPWIHTMEYVAKTIKAELQLKERDHDTDLRALLPLDDSEYRQFVEFLKQLDPRREYGYLKAVFCPRTGHFQWLCRDHAQMSKRGEQRVNSLEAVVHNMRNAYNGDMTYGKDLIYFDRVTGELGIILLPGSKAMVQLYGTFVVTPGIKKVVVALPATTSERDFDALIKALDQSNTPVISLDGSHLQKAGSWSNSILQALTNKRCQTLQVKEFNDFFKNITKTKCFKPSFWLRHLHLQCVLHTDQQSTLRKILGLCPALQNLTIKTEYNEQLRQDVCCDLPRLRRLTVLGLDGNDHDTILQFSKDDKGAVIYTIEVQVVEGGLPILIPAILPYLTTLRINNQRELNQDLIESLKSLIPICPKLATVSVQLALQHLGKLANLLEKYFTPALNVKVRYFNLRSLESEHQVAMMVKLQGPSTIDKSIEIEMTENSEGNDHLKMIFQSYGSHVKFLVFNGSTDDSLLEAYIASIADNPSELGVLSVDSSGLSTNCCLQTILDRSPSLGTLELSLSSLETEDQLQKAKSFIELYGEKTTNLQLSGNGSNWLSGIGVGRSQLKRLQYLVIATDDMANVESYSVNQILKLISSPTSGDILSLRSVSLCRSKFSSSDWKTILSGLDMRTLEHLSFEGTNFELGQMKALARKIPNPTALPLRELVIRKTPAAKDKKRGEVETDLLLRLPSIRVIVDEVDL